MQRGRRPHCMARLLYCERRLLRARRFRTRRRGRALLFVGFLQRIQNTAAARWHRGRSACGLRLRGRRDDRARLPIVARKPRQKQARDEEAGSQDRRRPAQEVGRTRLDMKPAPPPMPRPPPSDFCSNTVAISVATIIRWITITTVCISTFRRKPKLSAFAGLDFAGL